MPTLTHPARTPRLLAALLLCLATTLSSAADSPPPPLKPGDTVYRLDLASPDALKPFAPWGKGSATILRPAAAPPAVRIDAPQPPGHKLRTKLPVEQLRGLRLAVSATISADDVVPPQASYQGIKLVVYTNGPAGPKWQHPSKLWGSFAPRQVHFAAIVPPDATEAYLEFGIEATTGSATFADIAVVVSAAPRSRPAVRPALTDPARHPDRRTDIPRFRGVMHGPISNEQNIKALADWNVNLIRWQLHWVDKGRHDLWKDDLAAYDAWLNKTLDHLDTMLPVCRKYGIRVVVDLHTPPGGGILLPTGSWPLFQEKQYQDHFLKTWDLIAACYRGNPTVWGYDLANEPIEGTVAPGLKDWRTLSLETCQRIRKIDPDHALVIAPGPGGGWENLAFFEPLPVPGVVYSPHMYVPGEFTHQGVFNKTTGIEYPGVINKKQWDKQALRNALQAVRDYQLDYDVPIYIGEFSAIRWAPGDSAKNYLSDCIDIFEEYGWDWTYHAFREWSGWSVEHDGDPKHTQPSPTPTPRQQLLRKWFDKNIRAGEGARRSR